ncbi:unnamed protein product [Phyllotreta striolata]|uniref:Ionotropic glutamate receptor C-terminal domain-containing protein n=1 Tax=Phyllotreta striolata TaxID=444603 RepID=A0A9N9TLN3_PHYSR|nr:unnamed protein product [Phyllotreta striolata]
MQTCFIFVNPGYVKPGAEVLKPFASNTWCLFIISGLAIGISINLAFWVEYIFGKINTKYSLCTSMVITISVLTQQGSSIVPFGTAGRIIYLNLLVFSIIIYNYYTSSLVSSLLSTVPDAIGTIKELYESNLKVVVEKRPYTLTYILQQKNNRYIDLLNRTKIFENDIPNYLPPEEGIAKVRLGTHAYHTDDVTAYFLLDREDQELVCDLAEINLIQNSDIGLVLQKYSQYTELFQISLRKMQTSGVYHREKTFWIPRKPVCLLTTRVKAVGINELFLVYLILCSGVFLAIFILCLEITSSRLSNFRFCYDTRRHKYV